jgi:prevent-host-death family protein
MKTITALELRAKVGQYLDEAAAGERIVVERAGQPLCALVPLVDIAEDDGARLRRQRLSALAEIRRLARLYPVEPGDSAALVRRQREERTAQILRAVDEGRRRHAVHEGMEEG